MTNEQIIWEFLKKEGFSDAGAAGMLGNLYAESALSPINLQNTYNNKLGYTDEEYTKAVDNGTYTNFVKDSAGYGLAQWTFWSRKQNLLNYAKQKGMSIGNLTIQLEFLMQELKAGYSSLLSTLKTTTSVREASNGVLLQFERPADQSVAVQDKRAQYSQGYYDKYATKSSGSNTKYTNSSLVSYTRLSPNCTSPRNHEIDTISIHCVVGQLTAQQICNIGTFTTYNSINGASCNYAIGRDGSIGLCVEEKNRSWCTSSKSNDHRAITIEVASDTAHPYAVTDAAYEALIKLVADICKRNNIKQLLWQGDKNLIGQVDKQNMTVHRWFANKACPGDYLYNRHGDIANRVNALLQPQQQPQVQPDNNIIEEEEEMTQEKFNAMMDTWIAEQAQKDASDWSAEARAWAEGAGLIAGDETGRKMYKKHLTREEFITVLYRALHRYFM